jgi:hypothetical protein
MSELRLQKLSIQGSLQDRQARLRDALKVELKLELVTQAISRGEEGKEAALILISQATPCVMHLENRRGGKKYYSAAFSRCKCISASGTQVLIRFHTKRHERC